MPSNVTLPWAYGSWRGQGRLPQIPCVLPAPQGKCHSVVSQLPASLLPAACTGSEPLPRARTLAIFPSPGPPTGHRHLLRGQLRLGGPSVPGTGDSPPSHLLALLWPHQSGAEMATVMLCPETLLDTPAPLTPSWSCPGPHQGRRAAQEQRPFPTNATEAVTVLSQVDGRRGLGHPDLGHPWQ